MIFIRSDDYREIVGPDWALHLETALCRGDSYTWPVRSRSRPTQGGAPLTAPEASRPCSPGRPGAPLIVTTESPILMRAALRFAAAFAWTLVGSGAFAALSWALLL